MFTDLFSKESGRGSWMPAMPPQSVTSSCNQTNILVADNFSEFIAIMVGNAKTKDQINAELSDLIGDDFDPTFTDWLFNEVDELSYSQTNGHGMQEDSMETETQPYSSSAESNRRSLRD